MSSDLESELFIITQAVFVAVLHFTIKLSENNLNLYLRVQTTSREAVDNFNNGTEDLLTDLFTDKEPARDHYRWTRKFRRGMKQDYYKTQR